jgi:hypothetical protein
MIWSKPVLLKTDQSGHTHQDQPAALFAGALEADSDHTDAAGIKEGNLGEVDGNHFGEVERLEDHGSQQAGDRQVDLASGVDHGPRSVRVGVEHGLLQSLAAKIGSDLLLKRRGRNHTLVAAPVAPSDLHPWMPPGLQLLSG